MAEHFGEITERLRRSTVQVIDAGRGGGSGVVWSADGCIVTNAHVVQSSEPDVRLWDGRTIRARVERRNDRRDIASLRVPEGGLPAAEITDSGSVRPGEVVLAVGNPLGFQGALTTGVVHARGRVRALGRREWVQADIRLAPGNSGGPLADAKGRVIGINTMIVAGGLGLAVPSNSVTQFLAETSDPVMLGIVVRPVQVRGRQTVGLRVLDLQQNGPAAAASLRKGDVLLAANGVEFETSDDLGEAVEGAQGGLLRIEFVRDGRTRREVPVRLQRNRAEAA